MTVDIAANVQAYLQERSPTARYSSFDYCYNYFQSHRDRNALNQLASPAGMQLSCLQLAFYLASWGMLRGSSVLLRRSSRHYAPVIQAIVETPPHIWEIDAHNYSDEKCDLLLGAAAQIRAALPDPASDILVTKIMLGVYGCVPASDTYFRRGFGTYTLGARALRRVGQFYRDNQAEIEANRARTLDFDSGQLTERRYPRAKVIDMSFFIEGY